MYKSAKGTADPGADTPFMATNELYISDKIIPRAASCTQEKKVGGKGSETLKIFDETCTWSVQGPSPKEP